VERVGKALADVGEWYEHQCHVGCGQCQRGCGDWQRDYSLVSLSGRPITVSITTMLSGILRSCYTLSDTLGEGAHLCS